MRQLSRRVATAGALVALAFAGSAVSAQAQAAQQLTAAADRKLYGCQWDRDKCVRGRETLAGLGYSTTGIADGRHCTAPGCYNGFYFYYWK
jgi:uncharacterized membrane protein